jgi:hypothetical protein
MQLLFSVRRAKLVVSLLSGRPRYCNRKKFHDLQERRPSGTIANGCGRILVGRDKWQTSIEKASTSSRVGHSWLLRRWEIIFAILVPFRIVAQPIKIRSTSTTVGRRTETAIESPTRLSDKENLHDCL